MRKRKRLQCMLKLVMSTVSIFKNNRDSLNNNTRNGASLLCPRLWLPAYIPFDLMFLRMWCFIGKVCFHRLIVLLELKSTGITLSMDCSVGYGLVIKAYSGSHVNQVPGLLGGETHVPLFPSSLHFTPTLFQIPPSPPLQS